MTGGAGFVGSHLCRRLVGMGNEVICLDNFFTGRKENIKNLDCEVIRHDITDPIKLEVDLIFHLACPASPVHYQINPVKTIKTAVAGSMNVLDIARDTGVRILLASTSEIYGDPTEHPQRESYHGNVNTTGVRSCYDEGKRVSETLFADYQRQYGTDIRIARIFNTYGPMMRPDDGRVISNFIIQALNGEPITIYGDGAQTRSFMYISDLVDALVSLMESDYTQPINIGNPNEIMISELAEKIRDLVDSESIIIYKDLPGDDPFRRKPDITLAVKLLGWSPVVGLDDGLKQTIKYFDNCNNISRQGKTVSQDIGVI